MSNTMKEYLDKHKIEEALDKAVKELVADMPEDPFAKLGEIFAAQAQGGAAKMGEEGEKKMTKAEKKAAKKAEKGGDKAEKKDGGEKKKGGKPDAAELEKKARAKLVAKVEKEGGKKGVEVEGASDMGGLAFFCTYLMEPDGDLELTELGFNSMNAEPDPTQEERRGGAGHVGKMVFSAGQRTLAVLCNVPENRLVDTPDKDPEKAPMQAMHAGKWVNTVVDTMRETVKGEIKIVEEKDTFAKALIELNDADIEAGVAAIKLKDEAMKEAYKVLNEHNCFEDDGDESEVIYHFEGEGDDY